MILSVYRFRRTDPAERFVALQHLDCLATYDLKTLFHQCGRKSQEFQMHRKVPQAVNANEGRLFNS